MQTADGEVTVRDHGPGIAPEDLPHVFDRFYRSPAARGTPGSGLGLAIVRQVVESHGGTVSAGPAEGGGTVVRLAFPRRLTTLRGVSAGSHVALIECAQSRTKVAKGAV